MAVEATVLLGGIRYSAADLRRRLEVLEAENKHQAEKEARQQRKPGTRVTISGISALAVWMVMREDIYLVKPDWVEDRWAECTKTEYVPVIQIDGAEVGNILWVESGKLRAL